MGSLEEMERRGGLRPREAPPSSGGHHTLYIVVGLGLVVGVLAVWLLVLRPQMDAHDFQTQAGQPESTAMLDDTIIAIDRVSTDHLDRDTGSKRWETNTIVRRRITVLDASTGGVVLQKIVKGAAACRAAYAGLAWCDFDGKLGLYDARTLALVLDVGAELEKQGRTIMRDRVTHDLQGRIEGARAMLLLDDGRIGVADATTRSITRAEGGQLGTLHVAGVSPCQDGSGTRGRIAGSKDTFLDAAALPDRLIVHHASLDRERDALQLSKLDAAGGTVWTIDLGRGSCHGVTTSPTRILIATTNPQQRVVAIAPATGAVAWRATF